MKGTSRQGRRLSIALSQTVLRSQSDRRLVEIAREGSEAAFETLVHRYSADLHRYCRRFVDPDLAEDVSQHAFTGLHKAIMSGNAEINVPAWLHRTAHNRAIDILRLSERRNRPLDELTENGGRDQVADATHARAQLETLLNELDELPERQRAAVLMRFEGMTQEQIAEQLGGSAGAANQLLMRARRRLRDALGALLPIPLLRAISTQAGRSGHVLNDARIAELVGGGAAAGGEAFKAATAVVLATAVIATGGFALQHSDERDIDGPKAGTKSQPAASAPAASAQPRSVARAENNKRARANRPRPPASEAAPTPQQGLADPIAQTPASSSGPLPVSGDDAPSPSQPGEGGGTTARTASSSTTNYQGVTVAEDEATPARNDFRVTTDGDGNILIRDAAGNAITPGGRCTRPGNDATVISCPGTPGYGNPSPPNVTVLSGQGDDRVVNDSSYTLIAYGGEGDDTLEGGDGMDSLLGGDGSDSISGRGGSDLLTDGDGDLTDLSDKDSDRLDGGAGDDTIFNGSGNDTIDGGPGDDMIGDQEGDDTIDGGDGNDVLFGGPGDDVLVGGLGVDLLYGDTGIDRLLARDGEVDNVLSCGGDDGDMRDADPQDPDPDVETPTGSC